MAFPESSILDNFNRGDEGPPLSSDWTEMGHVSDGLEVVSNEAEGETGFSAACTEYWNPATFGPACEAYVTISDMGVTSVVAVGARLTSPGTASITFTWKLLFSAQALYMRKRTATQSMASVPPAPELMLSSALRWSSG